jgi:hypothetical protein
MLRLPHREQRNRRPSSATITSSHRRTRQHRRDANSPARSVLCNGRINVGESFRLHFAHLTRSKTARNVVSSAIIPRVRNRKKGFAPICPQVAHLVSR